MRSRRVWALVLFVWLAGPAAVPALPVSAYHFEPEDALPNKVRPGDPLWVRGGPDATTIWFQRATTEDAPVFVQAGAPRPRTVFDGVAGSSLQVRHFVAPPDGSLRVTSEASAWVGVLPHGALRETTASLLVVTCATEFQAFLWDRQGASTLSVTQPATMARLRVVVLPANLVWDRAGEFTSGDAEISGDAPLLVVVDPGPPGDCGGDATLRLEGREPPPVWATTASGGTLAAFVLAVSVGLVYLLWRRGEPNFEPRKRRLVRRGEAEANTEPRQGRLVS